MCPRAILISTNEECRCARTTCGPEARRGEVTPTPDIDEAKSTKTREQVREELDDYVRSGQRDRDRGETQVGG